jgi:hypothetical protein
MIAVSPAVTPSPAAFQVLQSFYVRQHSHTLAEFLPVSPGCHTTCIAAGVAICSRLSVCHATSGVRSPQRLISVAEEAVSPASHTTASTEHPRSMRNG